MDNQPLTRQEIMIKKISMVVRYDDLSIIGSELTCEECSDNKTCSYAFDGYNTNGDCLSSK